jgi:hypothetical protein
MRARCYQCPDVPLKNRSKRAQRSDWRLSQQHRPISTVRDAARDVRWSGRSRLNGRTPLGSFTTHSVVPGLRSTAAGSRTAAFGDTEVRRGHHLVSGPTDYCSLSGHTVAIQVEKLGAISSMNLGDITPWPTR